MECKVIDVYKDTYKWDDISKNIYIIIMYVKSNGKFV